MKLYIVRHGQCEWNALHKVCGSTDSPLTEKGRAQAAETAALVAEMTKDEPIDLIIASPLSRALETGKAIQAACGGVPLVTDDRIREINFGDNEGRDTRDPDFQAEKRIFPRRHPNGGETHFPPPSPERGVHAGIHPPHLRLPGGHPRPLPR